MKTFKNAHLIKTSDLSNLHLLLTSQTQSDSRAAWESKKGFSRCIKKVKNISFEFSVKSWYVEK